LKGEDRSRGAIPKRLVEWSYDREGLSVDISRP